MTDKTKRPAPSTAIPARSGAKRPYRAPTLKSTKAFERLALLSCPGASEEEGDCDEL